LLTAEERKDLIFKAINELVSDLLYWDRKEDPELPLGMIEEAVADFNPGVAMMAGHFEEQIRARIPLEGRVMEPGERIEDGEERTDGRGAAGSLQGHDPAADGESPPGDIEGAAGEEEGKG
jgi:hypothetical protein